jgi:opacity protein-like surface antigen
MFRRARLVALVALLAGLTTAGPARAAWEATSGELGRQSTRFTLHVGGGWAGVYGSDVGKVDPGVSLEAGLGFRVIGSVSLYAGYGAGSFDVKGQVVQLLGQRVRPDGRSGNVVGTYEPTRIRLGLLMNAFHTEGFKVVPYFGIGALLTTAKVTLDSVDGAPPQPSPDEGNVLQDPSDFDRQKYGLYLRAGAAWRLARLVSVYVDGLYEIVEYPPGLNSMATFNGGLQLHF